MKLFMKIFDVYYKNIGDSIMEDLYNYHYIKDINIKMKNIRDKIKY